MRFLIILIMLSSVVACTSATSKRDPTAKDRGLSYFMPKKDFVVTITMAPADPNDPNTTFYPSNAEFSTTEVYADRSTQYLLQPEVNWLADTKLELTVGSNGLLKTSKTTSTPKVSEAFEQLGTLAGQISMQSMVVGGIPAAPTDQLKCQEAGTYVYVFDAIDPPSDYCNVTITVDELYSNKSGSESSVKATDVEDGSGVFYRQDRPYKLTAESITLVGGFRKESIHHSPSGSPVLFAPISRSFFADSSANFVFSDGMLTSYTQDDKSEVVAALTIPAKVIGAYFKAAGEIFSSFSNKTKNESALLKAETELALAEYTAKKQLDQDKLEVDYKIEMAKLKLQACKDAVEKADTELIKSLNCAEI